VRCARAAGRGRRTAAFCTLRTGRAGGRGAGAGGGEAQETREFADFGPWRFGFRVLQRYLGEMEGQQKAGVGGKT
jgi:hypothetical protein